MKIKLSDVVNSAMSVNNEDGTVKEKSVLVQLQEIGFPVKVSYRIKRLTSKLEPILKTYNENKNELVTEFGEQQPNGTIKVTDEVKLGLFYTKLNELLETEDEVEFDKIKMEEVGDVNVPAKLLVDFIFE